MQISGVQKNLEEVRPSLTVDVGDLGSKNTTVIRWIMTTSLSGKFKNFNATYQHISPLNDPEISLIDSVDAYKLVHSVGCFSGVFFLTLYRCELQLHQMI